MMRRVLACAGRRAVQTRLASSAAWDTRQVTAGPKDGMFGNGWDNASLEIVFRSVIKRPHVREALKHHYAWATDERTLEKCKSFGDNCDIVQVQLLSDIGDPHRILKQFSIMDAPVIDIDGKHVAMQGGYVYYDDDGTKIAVIEQTVVEALAKELLWSVGYATGEPEPKDARKFLEDLYGDVQVPEDLLEIKGVLTDESLLYPEDVWPEAKKGGARYGKYQRGLGDH